MHHHGLGVVHEHFVYLRPHPYAVKGGLWSGEVLGPDVDGNANRAAVHVLLTMRDVSEGIVDQHEGSTVDPPWCPGGPKSQVGDTALILDSLPTPDEEIGQPRYQVEMKT